PRAGGAPPPGDGLPGPDNSHSLYWTQGPNLFRRDLATAAAFQPAEKEPAPAATIPLGMSVEAARPSGMLALTGARIVTMRGDEVIESGTVLIEGNRISAVGPTAAVSYPTGTRTLDLTGK